MGIPSAPHDHPGARQAAVAAPRAIHVAWCNARVITRLTCGGYALLFVIAGSLRIDLFQHANPGRGRSGPAAGPDCWPCACCWRSLPGLRVPPAHPAGPRAFWMVTAGSGAPGAACVSLFWGAVGHGRARCELAVVGHCNVVNNHLDDV